MEINVLIYEDFAGGLEVSWLQGLAEQVLLAEDADSSVELGLVIASQGTVCALNRDYGGRDEPTDVLAFSVREDISSLSSFVQPPDGAVHLGEVIISYPQAVMQAGEQGHSVNKEIATLVVHGVLHLLGYDHDEPERERRMVAREREIMSRIEWGLE